MAGASLLCKVTFVIYNLITDYFSRDPSHAHHGMDLEINWIGLLLKILKQSYIFVHQHTGLNVKMV